MSCFILNVFVLFSSTSSSLWKINF